MKCPKRLALCAGIILTIFGGAISCFAAEVYPEYALSAVLDDARKQLTVQQRTTFTNNSSRSVEELVFHVYANRHYTEQEKSFLLRLAGYFKVNPFPDGFEAGRLDVKDVKAADGVPLSFQLSGEDRTLLSVDLPEPLTPGASVTIAMQYVVTIPHAYGRFGWHDEIMTLSRWYPILSVLTEEGWDRTPFYPFHRPFYSRAAQYAVTLTLAENHVVVHTGVLAEESSAGDGTKTLSMRTDNPVREFSLAVSPSYRVLEDVVDGVAIKSFYLPGDQQHARWALEDARDVMRFYRTRFGPYPYKQFSIAPVYLGYGGEQKSNMITIDTRVYKLPGFLRRYFDFLISHETGHQWFYNIVGVNEYIQMWLEEGINSYFIGQYLEEKYGPDATVIAYPEEFSFLRHVFPRLTFARTRDYRYKVQARQGGRQPVIGAIAGFRDPTGIFSVTYGKGSRIVGMLRYVIGEDAFHRVFKRIFTDYRFGNLLVEDFQRICEEESGQDLDPFFRQWLYTGDVLDYGVSAAGPGTVTLRNHGGVTMPVEVYVTYADGEQENLIWAGEADRETVALSREQPVATVIVDPDDHILDIDRTNNTWPRKLNFHPVPLFLGLYDLPLFLPEDGYNLVVGPDTSHGLGIKAAWYKPYEQKAYAGTGYEFDAALHHVWAGYQWQNLFASPTTAGIEVANTADHDDGEDDVASGMLYLRRELWPQAYGLGDMNDHMTLYLLRNRGWHDRTDLVNAREDDRNVDYSRRDEAIVGISFHQNRAAPYPDPYRGYRLTWLAEQAGHFWGATQYFSRSAVDLSVYHPVTARSKMALRFKAGGGAPVDKDLFRLGGPDGLRGYGRKTVRGAQILLGSLEYRFPLGRNNVAWYVMDNAVGVSGLHGVVFADTGQAWFSSFRSSELKKNVGVGLRCEVTIGAFLEKVMLRADVAQAINDGDQDTQFWFGIQHAF